MGFTNVQKNNEYKNKNSQNKLKQKEENNQKFQLDSLSFIPKSLKKFSNKFEDDYFKNKKTEKEEEEEKEKEEQSQKKYRTELCKYFEINGRCKFGDNCIFAHGKENLRENLCKKSGYKKRPCVNFFEKGFCMYGNRCQFSHDIKQFEKEENEKKENNFSYKLFFKELNMILNDDSKKDIERIKERPRLKVFKKFVKIRRNVYLQKINYVDEILCNKKK
jgi:butyrate response factor 1